MKTACDKFSAATAKGLGSIDPEWKERNSKRSR